jgi:hypothetical protein
MVVTIRTCIITIDAMTKAGHSYPLHVVEKIVEDFKSQAPNTLLGSISPDLSFPQRLGEVSHMVTDLEIDDGKLMATIQVLDTPQGKVLTHNLDVDFRLSGLGAALNGSIQSVSVSSINAYPK